MSKEINLPVKYFSQLDSQTDEGGRMCASSSNAMLANYLRPGQIHGPYDQSDDNYLKEYVEKHGDSTDPSAQDAALRDLGLNVHFSNTGNLSTLVSQLEKGFPVPCGILHHGSVDAPTGGGHWVLVKGINADHTVLYVNDPAGELDLVNGGYHINNNGANMHYSVKNFLPRWEVGSPNTGWCQIASK